MGLLFHQQYSGIEQINITQSIKNTMNTPKKDNGSKRIEDSVEGQKGRDDTSYTLVSYQRKSLGPARIGETQMLVYQAVNHQDLVHKEVEWR
jgi:hypothetical protein